MKTKKNIALIFLLAIFIAIGACGSGYYSTDADTIKGYPVSAGIDANTIPVRDSNGFLIGNITGIANSSSSEITFSVRRSSSQAIDAAGPVKIQFNSEDFDANNLFDSATNYRFTPTTAGKYYIGIRAITSNSDTSGVTLSIYKNGSSYTAMNSGGDTDSSRNIQVFALVDMNGTTDYIEGYISSVLDTSYNVLGNDSGFPSMIFGYKVN